MNFYADKYCIEKIIINYKIILLTLIIYQDKNHLLIFKCINVKIIQILFIETRFSTQIYEHINTRND